MVGAESTTNETPAEARLGHLRPYAVNNNRHMPTDLATTATNNSFVRRSPRERVQRHWFGGYSRATVAMRTTAPPRLLEHVVRRRHYSVNLQDINTSLVPTRGDRRFRRVLPTTGLGDTKFHGLQPNLQQEIAISTRFAEWVDVVHSPAPGSKY